MKTLIILLSFLVTVCINAQTFQINPADNFYDFMERNKQLYSSDTSEGGAGRQLERMNKVWGERLYPHGDFTVASNAIYQYAIKDQSLQNKAGFTPNWQHIGVSGTPASGSGGKGTGRMHCMAFDPNYAVNNTVYAGTNFGGLWKSTNGGNSWSVTGTDLLPIASVSDIAIDPNNGNHLFITTGNADAGLAGVWTPNRANINSIYTIGVYRSLDQGNTWSAINNNLLQDFANGGAIRRVIVNPTNGNDMYIATSEGVYRTSNALLSTPVWNKFSLGIPATDKELKGLEFHPTNPTTLYCSGLDIYESTNSGLNWGSLTGAGTGLDLNNLPNGFSVNRINIAVTPANMDILYAYIEGNEITLDKEVAYVFKYSVLNNAWTQIFYQQTQNVFAGKSHSSRMAIAVSPFNANEVYIGTTLVFGSRDVISQPFSQKSKYNTVQSSIFGGVHADVHGLEFDPIDPNKLFSLNDGGISTKDLTNLSLGGWTESSNGLEVSTIWTFDDYEFDSDIIIAGHQDNGTTVYKSGLWDHIIGGDGFGANINKNGGNLMWLRSNGNFYRFDYANYSLSIENSLKPFDMQNGGVTFFPSTFKMRNHPLTDDMYFGFSEIYRRKLDIPMTSNPNDLWEGASNIGKVVTPTFARQIIEYEISEVDPNYQYIATLGFFDAGQWIYDAKILRTTVGGCLNNYNAASCFDDVTTNLKAALGITTAPIITGIAIHSSNPSKIWVSLTGYDPNIRVWTSNDAGNTWQNADPNGTLNNLPANGIVYQEGSNDRLFLATDAGVYMKEGSGDWVKYGDIPNVRVVELKINYCVGKLRAATFGRGLWEGDIPESTLLTTGKVINGTQTWSGIKGVNSNIVIPNGSILTITGTLNMPKKGKIIVQLGGRLIVNGGTITNQCGQLWEGIEVVGDVNTSQLDILRHGRVDLLNGALIENANRAVRLHKKLPNGNNDLTSTGGVIVARNTTFKNNLKDIEFLSYQNFLPVTPFTPIRDLSAITNCDFIWDDTGNMFSLGLKLKNRTHFSMWQVHGVAILGNEFRNDFAPTTTNYQKGNGILSVDADYTVSKICNSSTFPCTSFTPNLFQHLNVGISVRGLNATARVVIDGNVFDENHFSGVELLASTYTTVSQNTFNLPVSSITLEDGGDAIGIFSTGSYGYNFEENTFTTTGLGPSNGSNYGIVANNSSLNGGLIYKNDFNNTIVGNLSSQDNTALSIDCNTHNAGLLQRYDMAITSGTLANQGSCFPLFGIPANNTFSTGCTGEEHLFYHNTLTPSFIYSALSADLPTCFTGGFVLNNPCVVGTQQNTCPSNINNPLTPTGILATLSVTRTEITTLKTQFDGGDQNNLIAIINNQANGQVKNELLTASPYLSDKVLVTFLQKPNPLPAGHIKQIIVANSPVSIKIKGVIDNITLPNGIRNQINTVQTGISERQLLENQITQLAIKIQLLKNDFVRQCLDSNLIVDIKALLEEDKTASDKAALLPLIVKTDQQQTTQLITELRADANELRIEEPNSKKAAEIDKLCDFFTCVKDRITVSGNFNQLTATDEQTMRTLATTSGAIAINAQNALAFFKGEVVERFAEPIIITASNNRMGVSEKPQISNLKPQTVNYQLNNYPNPFNENTVIEVTIPKNTKGKLYITDVTGKQLKKIELIEGENILEIAGVDLGYGIFFYSLYVNDRFMITKKMTRMR